MKKIIIDTNFLLIPFSLKVDIFSEIDRIINDEYKLFIIDKTMNELNSIIENQKGKNKDSAKFALEILKMKKLDEIQTEENDLTVDDEILKIAKDENYIIATQDKELKDKIKKFNRNLIVLRQKSHLELV